MSDTKQTGATAKGDVFRRYDFIQSVAVKWLKVNRPDVYEACRKLAWQKYPGSKTKEIDLPDALRKFK